MGVWNWVRELCRLMVFVIWAKIAEGQRAGRRSVQASPNHGIEFPKKYTKDTTLSGGPTGSTWLSPYQSSLDSLYSDSIPLYEKGRLNYKHGLDAYET